MRHLYRAFAANSVKQQTGFPYNKDAHGEPCAKNHRQNSTLAEQGERALAFAENGVCGKRLCPNAAGRTEQARSKFCSFRHSHFHGVTNRKIHTLCRCRLAPIVGFRRGFAAAVTERKRQRTGALGAAPRKSCAFCFSHEKFAYIALKSRATSRGRKNKMRHNPFTFFGKRSYILWKKNCKFLGKEGSQIERTFPYKERFSQFGTLQKKSAGFSRCRYGNGDNDRRSNGCGRGQNGECDRRTAHRPNLDVFHLNVGYLICSVRTKNI